MNLIRQLAVVLVALGSVSVAQADLIVYDEAVSGDLVHGLPYDRTLNIGTLGIGENTVSGNFGNTLFNDTGDEFNFFIAEGTELFSVVFEFSNLSSYVNAMLWLRHIDDPIEGSVLFRENYWLDFSLSPSPLSIFEAVLPLGSGLYQISSPGSAGSYSEIPRNLDYVWKLNVREATVPEPGTLALFGIGLAAMGLVRRKKKV